MERTIQIPSEAAINIVFHLPSYSFHTFYFGIILLNEIVEMIDCGNFERKKSKPEK